MNIKTLSEYYTIGKMPEILFWVGCFGSFDDRAKKITQAFAKLLIFANIEFGILGPEENCTGDPAKRAGNELLFQIQAIKNIKILKKYNVQKIVTACPHCFNTIKNEYPELGGDYEILHHTEFLIKLIKEKRIKINNQKFKNKKITLHDPCYLGRGNNKYEDLRELIKTLNANFIEMKRNKNKALCCGAGGAQIFKESEPCSKEINIERSEEAIKTNASIVTTACPFCNIMLSDGMKEKEKNNIFIKDIVELIIESSY